VKKKSQVQKSMFSLWNLIIFFLLVAFTVTCCFLMFFSGADIPEDIIRARAGKTFCNVLVLSVLFSLIDYLRRKLTVQQPVNRILEATRRMTRGDFTARIEPLHRMGAKNEFDIIIENFNHMAEEVAGIETMKTDFIADVSHELKTPLSVIQNYAAMLKVPDLPEDKRMEYAGTVADAARRFSEMITNILKLNKLENQQIFPEAQRYNLGEQLCECLLAFENTWEQKELGLDIQIEEDVLVEADRELLNLVWNNLFSNAMKFTPPCGRVAVRLETDNADAVVTVTDTGCGMSRETGQHIFEKFYQGDASHGTQGNGLGLALVKRIIDITGAEISVTSELGKGSCFTVRFGRIENGGA
jgi:signal transduction histidine kinase